MVQQWKVSMRCHVMPPCDAPIIALLVDHKISITLYDCVYINKYQSLQVYATQYVDEDEMFIEQSRSSKIGTSSVG